VAAWAAKRPDLGLRVYRTLAGLRCLVTNVPFEPASPEAQSILRELRSDPLYTRLCQAQECFRARLTPKPWRCSAPPPPSRYPWLNVSAETRYRQWEQDYESLTEHYTGCCKSTGPARFTPTSNRCSTCTTGWRARCIT
jgi:hypothetical protein